MLRNCECAPGDKGCVLRGRYEFPLKDEVPKPSPKKRPAQAKHLPQK